MLKKSYNSTLIIICSFLLFGHVISCSKKATVIYNRNIPFRSEAIPVATPLSEWVIKLPDGINQTIGISTTAPEWKDMYQAAREMATVQYARNLSSYNIDKYIRVEKFFNERVSEEHRTLIFQVSDAQELWEIYERMHLMEYYILQNSYLVALFQIQDGSVLSDSIYAERKIDPTINVEVFSIDEPSWFSGNRLVVEENQLLSLSSATSACLIDAWEKASQNARFAFANYFSTSVESALENVVLVETERQRRVIALETLYNTENIELKRAYFVSAFRENRIRYTVYIEMKMAL